MGQHDNSSDNRIGKPRRRRFRILRNLLFSFLIVLAVLAAWISRYYFGKPTIKVDYVQKLNDLTRPADYDPNENAAPLYEKAFAAFNRMPLYRYKVTYDPNTYANLDPRYMDGMDLRYIMMSMHPISGSTSAWPWPGDLDPNNLRILEEWIHSNEESMKYTKQATQKPYYWIEQLAPNDELFELSRRKTHRIPELTRLLSWEMKLLAFQGEDREVLDNYLKTLIMADHLKGQRRYIDHVITLAVLRTPYEDLLLILNRSDIDVKILEEMQKTIEAKELDTTFHLQAERFNMQDLLQRTFTDDGRGNGHFLLREYNALRKRTYGDLEIGFHLSDLDDWSDFFSSIWDRDKEPGILSFCFWGEDRKATQARIDKLLMIWNEVNEQPFYWIERSSTLKKVESIYFSKGNLFIQTFFPLLRMKDDSEIIAKTLTLREAVITVLALLRYKAEYNAYPDDLESLIEAGFLRTVPIDHFNGNPILYRKMGDDFILYSVGNDGMDNISFQLDQKNIEFTTKEIGLISMDDILYWPVLDDFSPMRPGFYRGYPR
ncbi:MAG: hypothetical protein JXA82_12930 [Sedimentisphaerales bacterium]|nr:hypothetical protein [Sedimentisphaerales bacterium]